MVEIVFRTELSEPLNAPESSFSLPISTTPQQLNDLVNQLLESEETFTFVLNGQMISGPLEDHLKSQGVSIEAKLEVWYIKSLPDPEVSDPTKLPEWVSGVQRVNKDQTLVSDYSGTVYLYSGDSCLSSRPACSLAVKTLSTCEDKFIAGGKDRTVLMGTFAGEVIGTHEGTFQSAVEAVCWNPLGTLAVAGTYSGSVALCEPSSYEYYIPKAEKRQKQMTTQIKTTELQLPHRDPITVLQWPQLDLLYTSAMDHCIYGYDLEKYSISSSITTPRTVQALHIEESIAVVGMESGQISLFDLRTGQATVSWLQAHWVRGVGKIGTYIASGNDDGVVHIWDIRAADFIKEIKVHDDKILCMNIVDNEILTGSADCSFKTTKIVN